MVVPNINIFRNGDADIDLIGSAPFGYRKIFHIDQGIVCGFDIIQFALCTLIVMGMMVKIVVDVQTICR